MYVFTYYFHITVSVPEVPATVTTEKAKSKQELSRNEHLAAIKHEGELYPYFFITKFYMSFVFMSLCMYVVLLLNIEQETKARLEMIKSCALEKIQHIKVCNLNVIKTISYILTAWILAENSRQDVC